MIILAKIIITITIVTTLSVVAERVSPRAAGLLSGYPLGSAIALFFIGLEQGADFAGRSALYNIAGLAGLLTFIFLYYRISAGMARKAARASIPAATLAGLAGFFLVNGALYSLHLPGWVAALTGCAAILFYRGVFRRIPNVTIGAPGGDTTVKRVRLQPAAMLFRSGVAAGVILLVTGAAHLVPPSWAGLFSAFPATLLPLLLILHANYGPAPAHTVIKNTPTGLGALVLYSLSISAAYPRVGIGWGSLLGFAAATAYLLALAAAHRYAVGHSAKANATLHHG
jgi:hypothetical protein